MADLTSSPPAPAARRPAWVTWLAALLALLLATALLHALRPRLDRVHVALVYLLVVLGGSAAGGRGLGLVLSALGFLAFNFLFLPPYRTLVIADPFDWLILVTFLLTGIVAAQLLYRAQAEADVARNRAAEVDRLAALGAETLSAGRADEALAAIARVLRTTLGVRACEVYTWDAATHALAVAVRDADAPTPPSPAPTGVAQWAAEHGHAAAELTDGTVRLAGDARAGSLLVAAAADATALYLPLAVRGRVVGVLVLSDDRAITLDPTRQRYLEALAYYAALGVERVRLTAEAERAEALREADRLKNSLLATVSHDIRTPLTTIRALADDIAAGGDERALVITEEVDRLNRFVADLLDLSRLSAGGMPLAVALNAAEDLMGAALQRVSGMAAGREIRAALDPGDPVLVGRFDFAHSLRILANLLENALKYAPPSAPIDFTVRRDDRELVFAVADRGPGVPPDERARIFEPFYRPPHAAPDVGGAGLGLAIARGLAVAQGGSLAGEPREGGGSVFTLRLPAADPVEATFADPAEV